MTQVPRVDCCMLNAALSLKTIISQSTSHVRQFRESPHDKSKEKGELEPLPETSLKPFLESSLETSLETVDGALPQVFLSSPQVAFTTDRRQYAG